MKYRQKTAGFILPAVIMLGLGIMTTSVGLYSMSLSSSTQLNDQTFDSIARDAAQAGVSMAEGCVRSDPAANWVVSLTPGKTCNGTTPVNINADAATANFVAVSSDKSWKSTFEVRPLENATEYGPDAKKAKVIGTVQQYQGSNPVGTPSTASRIVIVQSTRKIMPSPTGEVATDIKANSHICSVNNGKLYCWGPNTFGMIGDGTTTQRKIPTLVSALANKYVSKISVSDSSTCAIADGEPYCWGNNLAGQVGNGGFLGATPSPARAAGGLTGRLVTDISTSPSNTPLPQFIPTAQHSCAVTDGAPYCWGGNDYQQVGALSCSTLQGLLNGEFSLEGLFLIPIITVLGGNQKLCHNLPFTTGGTLGSPFSTLVTTKPAPVFGYEDWDAGPVLGFFSKATKSIVGIFDPIFGAVGVPGPGNSSWFGLKASGNSDESQLYNTTAGMPRKIDRVAAGSHYSCALTEGKLYCWGIALPFNFGMPLFTLTVQPFNYTGFRPSAGSYQGNINDGYTFGSGLEANSFGMDGDMVCAAKSRDVGCMGFTPAYTGIGSIISSYLMNAPFKLAGDVDAINVDDGAWAIPVFGAFLGSFCVNDGGNPLCMGTNPAATGTGESTFLIGALKPLLKNGTNGQLGLEDAAGTVKRTTKVAAAGLFGGLVANGQVFTWGTPSEGQLGNNDTPAAVKAPTQLTSKIQGGVTNGLDFGTKQDSFAWTATGVGKNHACGIQNGQISCWGKNDKGQLGRGNKNDVDQNKTPKTISGFNDKMFTKISSGTDHSCAIATGRLYCWGDNTYGQLGNGVTGGTYDTPAQISRSVIPDSARVTDVSTGDRNTCAIIDGLAWCWGDDSYGQLGNGTGGSNDGTKNVPVRVLGDVFNRTVNTGQKIYPATPTKIDVGATHVCAVAEGNGYCWGRNDKGQLGDGTTNTSSLPVKVRGGTADVISQERLSGTFTDISAGDAFSCGIINSIVSCWGRNDKGQLGTGFETGQVWDGTYRNERQPCEWLDGIPFIRPNNPNGCDGYEWVGFSKQGYKNATVQNMVTKTDLTPDKLAPTKVVGYPATNQALSISAGDDHTCAAVNGRTFCWGEQGNGRLGNGVVPPGGSAKQPAPQEITGGSVCNGACSTATRQMTTMVSVGGLTSCSVSNGKMLCWGDASTGKIGLEGLLTNQPVPAGVSDTVVTDATRVRGPVF